MAKGNKSEVIFSPDTSQETSLVTSVIHHQPNIHETIKQNKTKLIGTQRPTLLKKMHFNIEGLTNKVDALERLTQDNVLDVLCLVEHWLNT